MNTHALSVFLLSLFMSTQLFAETYLYKYKDNKGNPVVSSSVPKEAVKRGYSVVTLSGKIVEVIAPEMTQAEKEALKKQKALEEKQKAQDKADKLLRISLGDKTSAIETRDREARTIDQQITSYKKQAGHFQKQIDHLQKSAAQLERSWESASIETIERIEQLQRQIANMERSAQEKEEVKQKIIAAYNKKISRLEEISKNKSN